ncbi:MAG: ATP-binding protein [Gemmatimonadaceae bacterium]
MTAPILARAAAPRLDNLLTIFPIVVVTGPRQVGKSTLVQTHPALAPYLRLTLDDASTRAEAIAEPDFFVARAERMIIDEVQRAPDLLLAIKAVVDREAQRAPGHFVLTGSANLLMMKQVADSLAGRAVYLDLGPLTHSELRGDPGTGRWTELFEHAPSQWSSLLQGMPAHRDDWRAAVSRGGIPVPAIRLDPAARAQWFASYITAYVERDLRDLSVVELLGDFQQTMKALALRTGNPVNQSEIARDLGVEQRNISRWITLLLTSWLVTRLPAYAVNRTSRLMKRPKLYWADSALAMQVAGEGEPRGAHFENYIMSDLMAWSSLMAPRPGVFYWRTTDNAEVDFVIEHGTRLLAVEVKTTTRPSTNDWRHLKRFVAEYGDSCHGALLLHAGEETYQVSDRVVIAPWWRVL